MPEGDSIVRAARAIEAAIGGVPLTRVETPSPRTSSLGWAERLSGRTLEAAEPVGKHLVLRFDGDLAVHSHLRMSGRWHVYRSGARWRRARASAWLVLGTNEHDVVQFGGPVLEVTSTGRLRRDPRLRRLGHDVLAPGFAVSDGVAALRAADGSRALGEVLLDQRLIAGIGNLFKSEACHAAGVSPWRAVGGLSDDELASVVSSARTLMEQGAGRGRGRRAVYRRARLPCPRCGTLVRSGGQGDDNRTTYWCPSCQPP